MTEIFGTVACDVANTIFAPWRMMPSRSTLLPTMKPATSARYTSEMLNALQSQMKRAALSDESTMSTPPFTFGWLATMPTARPSMRASPTMTSPAKSFLISNHEPASITRSMTSYMSNHLRWSYGTISSIERPGFGSAATVRAGSSAYEPGMYARYFFASSIASSSDAASTSPHPETSQCMRAPPSASSVVFSPIAISTMRGLPTLSDALPSTMIT